MPKKKTAPKTAPPSSWRLVPISELALDPNNLRGHDGVNRDEMLWSLRKFGQRRAATVRAATMTVMTGNLMVELLRDELGATEVVCLVTDDDELLAKEWSLVDNRMGEYGTWKDDIRDAVKALADAGSDIAAHGFDDQYIAKATRTFLEPPGDQDTTGILPELWGVIVRLENEQQQIELLERLTAEGYDVQAMLS